MASKANTLSGEVSIYDPPYSMRKDDTPILGPVKRIMESKPKKKRSKKAKK